MHQASDSKTSIVDPYAEFSAYAEQSRALLESLRVNFERERAMFAEERKMWERERAELQSRIAELESALNERSEKPGTSAEGPFRSDFSLQRSSPGSQLQQGSSSNGHQVCEGSSQRSKPTRVFADENRKPDADIPPLREHGLEPPPALDSALSPRSGAADCSVTTNVPVPMEKIGSNPDGITLKSTALPPEAVAKDMTPPSQSPLVGSPSQKPDPKTRKEGSERRGSLRLKLSDLGSPDENLKRDAGHTPMVILDMETEINQGSPSEAMSYAENPLEPVSTSARRMPAEQSDSYFGDLDDDPALTGPLSLLNDEEKDREFLKELDQKLLDEARKALSNSPGPSQNSWEDDEPTGDANRSPN